MLILDAAAPAARVRPAGTSTGGLRRRRRRARHGRKAGQLAGEGVTRPGSESIGQVARLGRLGRSSRTCREDDSIIKFGLTAHALHACNLNGVVRAERNK